MAISIQGINLKDISISRDKETGVLKAKGSYELVSSTGVILATQSFGGSYDSLAVDYSAESKKLINEFVQSLKKDLETTLGLV